MLLVPATPLIVTFLQLGSQFSFCNLRPVQGVLKILQQKYMNKSLLIVSLRVIFHLSGLQSVAKMYVTRSEKIVHLLLKLKIEYQCIE